MYTWNEVLGDSRRCDITKKFLQSVRYSLISSPMSHTNWYEFCTYQKKPKNVTNCDFKKNLTTFYVLDIFSVVNHSLGHRTVNSLESLSFLFQQLFDRKTIYQTIINGVLATELFSKWPSNQSYQSLHLWKRHHFRST